MSPGFGFFIRWLFEFAPLMALLVRKRKTGCISSQNLESVEAMQSLLQRVRELHQRESEANLSFEQEKVLQRQRAEYQRDIQLKLATQQREITLQLPEIRKILDNWPLRLFPAQILESHPHQAILPLKIFLAPPQLAIEPLSETTLGNATLELSLAEGIRQFLNEHYPLQSPIRPTEFLAGCWESKRFHSESSIKSLYGFLKSEPTLILESELSGKFLIFRIAYWGFGQETYYYKTIAKLPYWEMLQASAKSRAQGWKEIRAQLLASGEDPAEVDRVGRENVGNLELLEKEQRWQTDGINTKLLNLDYQVNGDDFETLYRFLADCHCLVAAWIADIYHLTCQDVPPLLPTVLPQLMRHSSDSQLIQAIATGYQQVYAALEDERRAWVPELSLQLAQSLATLPDPSLSQEQAAYSFNAWLQLHQFPTTEVSTALATVKSHVTNADQEYFEQLKAYFEIIGDEANKHQVEEVLETIATHTSNLRLNYPSPPQWVDISLLHTLTGYSGKTASLAISPDEPLLISGAIDHCIQIWNLQSGELMRTLKDSSHQTISAIALSPTGEYLVTSSEHCPQRNVKVWHLETGKLLQTLTGHKKPVHFVAVDRSGKLLLSASNKIKIWDLAKGKRLSTFWHSCTVNSAMMLPHHDLLVSGSSDRKIKLWNLSKGNLIRTLQGHQQSVSSVAMTPDGQILVSGSADQTLKLWELETGKPLHTLKGHSGAINAVTISPDGRTVISGSDDHTIKLWDIETGSLLLTLTGHRQAVKDVVINQDGRMIVSGSADQTIKVWHVAT
jgi:WD40 repeat protein